MHNRQEKRRQSYKRKNGSLGNLFSFFLSKVCLKTACSKVSNLWTQTHLNSWNEMKIKSCTVLIRSAPSFFELTYMLLQNNYVNNGETNGVK